ncbi:MAG TPA: hypothetical protein VKV17_14175 [Bryobacteraceae bacterium]|nr:hypothetical protein [Bryobacteraceae bacterium]
MDRRISQFSVVVGAIGVILVLTSYGASTYPRVQRWQQANLRMLSEISCKDLACDTSQFTTDWELSGADYVVDGRTGYFIDIPISTVDNSEHFVPLDYAETGFILGFRQPKSYVTPDGEIWRMFSREFAVAGKTLLVLVGYAQKAPWKMIETPQTMSDLMDSRLKAEAERIGASLSRQTGVQRTPRSSLSIDGFEVVDAATSQIVDWGFWVPTFLPNAIRPPAPGVRPAL